MSSENFLVVRGLLKKGHVGYVIDDTPVALRIRNTAGKAVTSVTLTAATNLVLIDADGTTTSTFATDTTLGMVCDRINASANWECKILDALRADASANTMTGTTISASTVDGVVLYDVCVDTSGQDSLTYRLTYDRLVGESKPKGAHRVTLREFQYNANVNAASADGVQIWECADSGKIETKVYSRYSVDATDTTVNWASGVGCITAADGHDLVVRIDDATSLTDAATNFLQVIGELE